ncbi:MAG: class I SAM-dependent methyltransferase [Candidatus Izemoplasmatales bacterium]
MAHYFTRENNQLESNRQWFKCFVGGKEFIFVTDRGVFSRKGLDFGSRLLLETILSDMKDSVLDLGCGYGPIGIILADRWNARVTMVDVNLRALELAQINASINKVAPVIIESDGMENISGKYALIVTNPPIRAGKQIFYKWFHDSARFLEDGGELVFVMKKDQGAKSAIAYLESFYANVVVRRKKSGYYIISCQKPLTI